MGTLGGGNHFIEVGYGRDEKAWIVIHSGSRGFGHKIASHYMLQAYLLKNPTEEKLESIRPHSGTASRSRFQILKAETIS